MVVLTSISLEETNQLIADLGIVAQKLVPILSGVDNTNYFLSTSVGEYVLTIVERSADQDIKFVETITNAFSTVSPIPKMQVLPKTHCEKTIIVSNRLYGSSPTEITNEKCYIIGAELAKMHMVSKKLTVIYPNQRGIEYCASIGSKISFTPEQYSVYTSEIEFQQSISIASEVGPIHGDLFPDNTLWNINTPVSVLDFYFSGCDYYMYDLAVTINAWGYNSQQLRMAVLDGYKSVIPLTSSDLSTLEILYRRAALRFWLSRLYDSQNKPIGEISAHDPDYFYKLLVSLEHNADKGKLC